MLLARHLNFSMQSQELRLLPGLLPPLGPTGTLRLSEAIARGLPCKGIEGNLSTWKHLAWEGFCDSKANWSYGLTQFSAQCAQTKD